jgi:hypothetical protein
MIQRIKLKEIRDQDEKRRLENEGIELVQARLPINRFELEIEASQQSELLSKAGRLLVKAADATRRAKNNLDIIEYEMMEDILKDPKKYNLPKTSDTVVQKAVKATKEYQKALNTFLFLKSKEEDYALLVDNVKNRGFQIKVLAELWLNQYYDKPNVYEHTKKKRLRITDEF